MRAISPFVATTMAEKPGAVPKVTQYGSDIAQLVVELLSEAEIRLDHYK